MGRFSLQSLGLIHRLRPFVSSTCIRQRWSVRSLGLTSCSVGSRGTDAGTRIFRLPLVEPVDLDLLSHLLSEENAHIGDSGKSMILIGFGRSSIAFQRLQHFEGPIRMVKAAPYGVS